MSDETLERVRAICLALPEAHERTEHRPAFAVRTKSFAMYMDNHHEDGRLAVWCKAPPDAQRELVAADPARYFVPPYVGPSGWVGVRLDVEPVDWDGLAEPDRGRLPDVGRQAPARGSTPSVTVDRSA